jgi:CRP-like cAMP-binding protein
LRRPQVPDYDEISSEVMKKIIDGHHVRNKILLALRKNERDAVFPRLEFVSLPSGTVLTETGALIQFAYFVNAGLVSMLNVMANNRTTEVGLCGRESFIGLPLTVGFTTSSAQVLVQVVGGAFRISAKDLVVALRQCPRLAIALQRFSQEMGLQSAQLAACHRQHNVDERLARWLLMSQDRLRGDSILLTQEVLSHILGTRRATVTDAVRVLQTAGLITYKRGTVKIEDRLRLEEAACECYETMTRQVKKWHVETA